MEPSEVGWLKPVESIKCCVGLKSKLGCRSEIITRKMELLVLVFAVASSFVALGVANFYLSR